MQNLGAQVSKLARRPRLRFLFSTTPLRICLPARRRWQRLRIRPKPKSTRQLWRNSVAFRNFCGKHCVQADLGANLRKFLKNSTQIPISFGASIFTDIGVVAKSRYPRGDQLVHKEAFRFSRIGQIANKKVLFDLSGI